MDTGVKYNTTVIYTGHSTGKTIGFSILSAFCAFILCIIGQLVCTKTLWGKIRVNKCWIQNLCLYLLDWDLCERDRCWNFTPKLVSLRCLTASVLQFLIRTFSEVKFGRKVTLASDSSVQRPRFIRFYREHNLCKTCSPSPIFRLPNICLQKNDPRCWLSS